MVKKKLQQVTNITNNGTNYGIIAQTVIVPDDKDVLIEDNYTITPITDVAFLKKYRNPNYAYELKPKQGNWNQPYIAYPVDEDSTVMGKIYPPSLALYTFFDCISNLYNDDHLYYTNLKIKGIIGINATRDLPVVFVCNKKPSILFFGDYLNTKKIYTVKFPL